MKLALMKKGYSKTGRQHPQIFSPVTSLYFLFMFIKSFRRL